MGDGNDISLEDRHTVELSRYHLLKIYHHSLASLGSIVKDTHKHTRYKNERLRHYFLQKDLIFSAVIYPHDSCQNLPILSFTIV